MHHSRSFGELSFCGGEEEAHDHWHDKWEAHRRSSMDEVRTPVRNVSSSLSLEMEDKGDVT